MDDGSPLPSDGFVPGLDAWDAWTPWEVARRLAGVRAPWYVAGGWAIDLLLGAPSREHEDLEIGVPADRFAEIAAALPECEFFVVGSGLARPYVPGGVAAAAHHQTWAWERAAARWRLDLFREPSADGHWLCRRDERIRLPHDRLIRHTADCIPYLRPEIVLLFKAKAVRPKDAADLAAVLPRLDADARAWLTEALALVHPDHPWLTELGGEAHGLNER